MYIVKKELPSNRKKRTKANKDKVSDYGKRWKRILEKRSERAARASMPGRVRRSAKNQGSL